MATAITPHPSREPHVVTHVGDLGAREMMRQLRFMLESRDRRGRAAAVSSAQELRGRSSCCRAADANPKIATRFQGSALAQHNPGSTIHYWLLLAKTPALPPPCAECPFGHDRSYRRRNTC